MQRLIAVTALSATLAFPAIAQDSLAMYSAEEIIGSDIYTTNESSDVWDWDAVDASRYDDWEDIGEIEDIILGADGQVIGIVAEVGGWLGLGEKEVLLKPENVRLVPVDDEAVYVTGYTEEELEGMEGVDDDMWED